MKALRTPPKPIIDNLNYLPDPFKQRSFATALKPDEPIKGAEADLQYALKFLYSYNGSTATFNSYL